MSRRRVMMMLFLNGGSIETKAFEARVEADGGLVESARCIDKKLGRVTYSSLTNNFIDRVVGDSGYYESAICIDKKLKLT